MYFQSADNITINNSWTVQKLIPLNLLSKNSDRKKTNATREGPESRVSISGRIDIQQLLMQWSKLLQQNQQEIQEKANNKLHKLDCQNQATGYDALKCRTGARTKIFQHHQDRKIRMIKQRHKEAVFTWISRNEASSIVNLEAISATCLYFSSYFLASNSAWNRVNQQKSFSKRRKRKVSDKEMRLRYLTLICYCPFSDFIESIITSTFVENLVSRQWKWQHQNQNNQATGACQCQLMNLARYWGQNQIAYKVLHFCSVKFKFLLWIQNHLLLSNLSVTKRVPSVSSKYHKVNMLKYPKCSFKWLKKQPQKIQIAHPELKRDAIDYQIHILHGFN